MLFAFRLQNTDVRLMDRKINIIFFLFCIFSLPGNAQEIQFLKKDSLDKNLWELKKEMNSSQDTLFLEDQVEIGGNVYSVLISKSDTLVLADLEDIHISSPRKFNSREEYVKYMRYKRYAAIVYPYAVEAVKLFKTIEYDTRGLKKRKRKKYIKGIQEDYKTTFEEPLKGLTKIQGKILVKMIERELETPMFELVKGVKGKFTAFYWNQFSKLYGYRLKQGYEEGKNPILDIVLQDFDIDYEVPAATANTE